MKQAQNSPLAGKPAARHGRARGRVLLVCAPGDPCARLAGPLRAAGFAVCLAVSGRAALAREGPEIPAIVLCAPMLPDMAGLDLCRALRHACPDRHIHVILVGAVSPEEALAALAGGADDVLVPPVGESVLRLRLAVAERVVGMATQLTEANRAMAGMLDNLRAAQGALDRDLAEARRLQQGLVRDRYRQFGPFRLSLLLRPSGHVGGDLIGCFPIGARRIGIYAIDVAGHGVTAALTAARISAWLSGGAGQNIALRPGGGESVPPAEVVGRLNRMMLADQAGESYFTMIYAELDTLTGAGRLVQAGHPGPILQAGDGTTRLIGDGGLPVGVIEEAEYDEVPFHLHAGERLFIASDGLTEAESPRGDLLGDEGLLAAMRMNAGLGGQAFVESLCWSVSLFTEGKQEDDISAVLIEHSADAAAEGAA